MEAVRTVIATISHPHIQIPKIQYPYITLYIILFSLIVGLAIYTLKKLIRSRVRIVCLVKNVLNYYYSFCLESSYEIARRALA